LGRKNESQKERRWEVVERVTLEKEKILGKESGRVNGEGDG
jgi:hypothetical protein